MDFVLSLVAGVALAMFTVTELLTSPGRAARRPRRHPTRRPH